MITKTAPIFSISYPVLLIIKISLQLSTFAPVNKTSLYFTQISLVFA